MRISEFDFRTDAIFQKFFMKHTADEALKICIENKIGAGVMGRGIAEVFAAMGVNITLYDAFPEQLQKA
jgi:pyruvate/2-oxoglutarate dehydrogenase complex dihydrolipoamide dehydrogenase (E3) component